MDGLNTELSWEELWSLSASLPKDVFGPLLTRYQEQEKKKLKPGLGSGVWDPKLVTQGGKPMEINSFPEVPVPDSPKVDPFVGRNDNALESLLDEYLKGLDKIEEVE